MRNKQLITIFVCTMVPLFIANGLFPFLPLYAAEFGATHAMVGLYFASMNVASVTGVMLAGWLAERFAPRMVFVSGGLVGIAAMSLMPGASHFWQVVLLTLVIWMCGSMTLTLLNMFTGMLATEGRNGRLFGLIFLAYPISAVLGGTAVGQLVASYGYATLFGSLAAIWLIQPLVGFFGLRDPRLRQIAPTSRVAGAPRLGRSFVLLLGAMLLALAAVSMGRLGVSLSMQALAFSPGAIASAVVASGVITIPASLLMGVLSDRMGRRPTLLLNFVFAGAGLGLLLVATQLWHFWVAATLLMVAWCATRSVASALATDVLPAAARARGLARLNAVDSVASIVGFASAGYGIDALGPASLYLVGVVLAGIAIQVLLVAGRRQGRDGRGALGVPGNAVPVTETAQP